MKKTNVIIPLVSIVALALLLGRATVEPQPAPIVAGAVKQSRPAWLPDPVRTPGATDPRVNQSNIKQTICMSGYTAKIRPPASYTTKLKIQQMKEYGLTGSTGDFEEDHLISLEIGGNPTYPKNLWPEAYAGDHGARVKDQTENYLHRQVCAGKIKLEDAQKCIAMDWTQCRK